MLVSPAPIYRGACPTARSRRATPPSRRRHTRHTKRKLRRNLHARCSRHLMGVRIPAWLSFRPNTVYLTQEQAGPGRVREHYHPYETRSQPMLMIRELTAAAVSQPEFSLDVLARVVTPEAVVDA